MLHPRKNLARVLAILFFLLLPPLALAEINSREEQKAGIQAAREGQYQRALTHFLNAKKAGLNTPGLNYNLAVSYYRLGKYSRAKKLFLALAKNPESRQLAYFNLGLVTNRQKKETEAITWFKRASQTKGGKRIRAMSLEALKRLGKKPAASPTWFGFASTNLLYDSNVTLANDVLTGITRQSDTAAQLIVNGSGWLKGSRRNGLRISLGAYVQKYKILGRNDFAQLNTALGQYNKLGTWQTRVYARWEESYFGGTNYQRAFSLDNRGKRSLGNNRWLLLRYKLSRLQATNSRFDYLGGWRQQIRLGSLFRKKTKSFTGYYQLELNDRQDRISPSGRFTSFSPTRHVVRARTGLDLNPRWRINLDGSYRYSAYRGINDLAGGISMRRVDQQYRANLSLSRRLSRRWELNTRYSFTRNDSTINLYGYSRYQITAGVNGTF